MPRLLSIYSAAAAAGTAALLLSPPRPANGSSSADCSPCDHDLTSPLYYGCTADGAVSAYVDFDGIKAACGDAVSLNATTDSIPTFHYPDAEVGAFYSLIVVDTTGVDPIVGSQPPFLPWPVLHYGAMNIPGEVLVDGMSLGLFHRDEKGVRVRPFLSYQPPIMFPEKLNKTDQFGNKDPDVKTRVFNYEYMLGKQKYAPAQDPVINKKYDNFQFIQHLKLNVDTTFENMVSTYISTGHCVLPDESGFGSDCPVPSKTESGYGCVPAHVAADGDGCSLTSPASSGSGGGAQGSGAGGGGGSSGTGSGGSGGGSAGSGESGGSIGATSNVRGAFAVGPLFFLIMALAQW